MGVACAKNKTSRNPSHRRKQCLIKIKRRVKAMIAKLNQSNETVALYLTKAFGTMWICYASMVYGALPAFAVFHPYQASFLYWSNWVQLWSLPLIRSTGEDRTHPWPVKRPT
jgi:hypothetical protein